MARITPVQPFGRSPGTAVAALVYEQQGGAGLAAVGKGVARFGEPLVVGLAADVQRGDAQPTPGHGHGVGQQRGGRSGQAKRTAKWNGRGGGAASAASSAGERGGLRCWSSASSSPSAAARSRWRCKQQGHGHDQRPARSPARRQMARVRPPRRPARRRRRAPGPC